MVQAGAELDAIVSAGMAHDDGIVAEHAGEGIHPVGRFLVGGVSRADLELAQAVVRETHEAVAVAEGGLGDIRLRRVGRTFTGGRRNRRLYFELVDEFDGAAVNFVRAAVAQHRLVGREIAYPAYASHDLRSLRARRHVGRGTRSRICIRSQTSYAL